MIKKILGGLLFVFAGIILIGSITNGNLFGDQGSAAATFGTALGTMIPLVLYVLSGIFLFAFDDAAKLNYIDGFKKRSKQATQLVVFTIIYFVLLLIASFSAGSRAAYMYYLTEIEINLYIIVCVLPYAIPAIVFGVMLQAYALPHWTSKKYFLNNEAKLQEYLSDNITFCARTNDNFVLASDTAIFFPRLFCVVPLDQIVSTKCIKLPWEQDVFVNLANGKKCAIAYLAMSKHREDIQVAIDASKQNQP